MKMLPRAEKSLTGKTIACSHDLLDELTKQAVNDTQRAVAEKLGISYQYLNDVLTGRRGISGELARRMGWQGTLLFVRD